MKSTTKVWSSARTYGRVLRSALILPRLCNKIGGGGGGGLCVALSVRTLAVNTIIKSSHIHVAEGVTDEEVGFEAQMLLDDHLANGSAAGQLSLYDQTAACAPVFRVLKAMVMKYMPLDRRSLHPLDPTGAKPSY